MTMRARMVHVEPGGGGLVSARAHSQRRPLAFPRPLTMLLEALGNSIQPPARPSQPRTRALDGSVHLLEQLGMRLELVVHLQAEVVLPAYAGRQCIQLVVLRGHLVLLRVHDLV